MPDRTGAHGAVVRPPSQPEIDYQSHPVFSQRPHWRRELHRIIFGNLTPGGRRFDVLLILAILVSVGVVMMESVASIRVRHGFGLRAAEWIFTLLFTVEYALRLVSAQSGSRYARTFFGIVDLLAILPTYLSLIVPGGQALAVIRILRVLRIFRVLKLAQFVGGEQMILDALRSSAHKIAVFLIAVLTTVAVVGAILYVVEGPENGFTSIPMGVYWAIVTITTVGFGDITPQTVPGQTLAALLMILGYGIIAVPTGIVTAEMVSGARGKTKVGASSPAASTRARRCATCARAGHTDDADFCRFCGTILGS